MTDAAGMLTDRYELTMIDAALRDGTADRRCVFEVFARTLPARRRFGVVAGTGRLIEAVERIRFDADDLEFLATTGLSGRALEWLADYRFTGTITGYREGEIYFPGSPVLTVEGGFAESVLLETIVLSILNHDSAVATAAARMSIAAGDRPLSEMGSRRTHEEAAVAAARAAYIAGFAATSNLAAGRRWGVPTMGTAAHAWTLLHEREEDAFRAQVAALGPATTLLVDTYDIPRGVATAVRTAGPELGGVRIDSGDLAQAARAVRSQLDRLGAERTRITVTSDLDEFAIAALAASPVDAYGVGTALVTGSGAPTAGMVYKMVARHGPGGWTAVAKSSALKEGRGGRKRALRSLEDGCAAAEVISPVDDGTDPGGNGRPLQVPLFDHGSVTVATGAAGVARAREHHRAARAELPAHAFALSPGDPAVPTVYID
jgi:nicotinate phosphoribosyltransferase